VTNIIIAPLILKITSFEHNAESSILVIPLGNAISMDLIGCGELAEELTARAGTGGPEGNGAGLGECPEEKAARAANGSFLASSFCQPENASPSKKVSI
jgi:hypothetical protein